MHRVLQSKADNSLSIQHAWDETVMIAAVQNILWQDRWYYRKSVDAVSKQMLQMGSMPLSLKRNASLLFQSWCLAARLLPHYLAAWVYRRRTLRSIAFWVMTRQTARSTADLLQCHQLHGRPWSLQLQSNWICEWKNLWMA